MGTPTEAALRAWAANYVALWNAGDKDAWVANWRKLVPGDFKMLDPVGTPEKRGFQECVLDAYDLFQPKVRFKIADGCLFVCANEVAWLLENEISVDGRTFIGRSIETYRFEDDGSVVIRTYYDVPERSPDELGEMFSIYLPQKD